MQRLSSSSALRTAAPCRVALSSLPSFPPLRRVAGMAPARSPLSHLSIVTLRLAPCVFATPVYAAQRHSQVSSQKMEGYYWLSDAKHIPIEEACYEVRTMRGGGPGGQGTNSSSNKVELRLDLELLALMWEESGVYDEERRRSLVNNIARNETLAGKHGSQTLIVSSHEHRSALQNREACLAKVRAIIWKASWVPPVPADPIETSSRTITQKKNERRRKSNVNRMRRAARQGRW